MLRPGFPRLSHAGVAHAIPSIAFIGPVYRRARLLVSPTISGVQLTDQQQPTQAPATARVFMRGLLVVPVHHLINTVPHTNVCTISPPAGRPPQWEDAADVPVPVRSGAVVCRSADGRLRGPRSWWGGLLGGSLTRRKLLMRWRLHGDEPRKPADAASTFADVPRWSRTPR